MPSYFSERTAEFAIIPVAQQIFKKRYGSAIPMYFWKTREGNTTSSEIHHLHRCRVLALFARRPKMADKGHGLVGKVNEELFEFADTAEPHGIQTIAALPVAPDIFQLHQNPRILWIHIAGQWDEDLVFPVNSMAYEGFPNLFGCPSLKVIGEDDLITISERCRQFQWDDAMEIIGSVRRESDKLNNRYRFFNIGGYRPVFFLLE